MRSHDFEARARISKQGFASYCRTEAGRKVTATRVQASHVSRMSARPPRIVGLWRLKNPAFDDLSLSTPRLLLIMGLRPKVCVTKHTCALSSQRVPLQCGHIAHPSDRCRSWCNSSSHITTFNNIPRLNLTKVVVDPLLLPIIWAPRPSSALIRVHDMCILCGSGYDSVEQTLPLTINYGIEASLHKKENVTIPPNGHVSLTIPNLIYQKPTDFALHSMTTSTMLCTNSNSKKAPSKVRSVFDEPYKPVPTAQSPCDIPTGGLSWSICDPSCGRREVPSHTW